MAHQYEWSTSRLRTWVQHDFRRANPSPCLRVVIPSAAAFRGPRLAPLCARWGGVAAESRDLRFVGVESTAGEPQGPPRGLRPLVGMTTLERGDLGRRRAVHA